MNIWLSILSTLRSVMLDLGPWHLMYCLGSNKRSSENACVKNIGVLVLVTGNITNRTAMKFASLARLIQAA